MLGLIVNRLFAALAIFLAVTLVLFIAVETLPGDFASAATSRFALPDDVERFRLRLGLDLSAPSRYVAWLTNAVRGDFGESWYANRPIAELLGEQFAATARLALLAALMAIPLGLCLGVLSAVYRDSLFDRLASSVSIAAISLPEFLVAYALMALFTVAHPVFPAHVAYTDDLSFVELVTAMTLPAASLAVLAVAPVMRLTRASLIGVLGEPYIELAVLKGLPRTRVVMRHALPNAMGPIVNTVVLVLANLVVGAVIVEQIFAYPGVGSTIVSAVKFRDIPLVLALGVLLAAVFILLNLFADIVAILANPRLRHQNLR